MVPLAVPLDRVRLLREVDQQIQALIALPVVGGGGQVRGPRGAGAQAGGWGHGGGCARCTGVRRGRGRTDRGGVTGIQVGPEIEMKEVNNELPRKPKTV